MWFICILSSLLIGVCSSQILGCSTSDAETLSKSLRDCPKPLISYGTSKIADISSGNLDGNTLTELCSHLRSMMRCTEQIVNNTRCLDDNARKISYGLLHSTDVAIEYGCENNAAIAKEFFKEDGVACFLKASSTMRSCFQEKAKLFDYEKFLANPTKEDLKSLCSVTDPAKKCILDSMRSHENVCSNRVIEVMNEAVERMIEGLPCGYKRPTSEPEPSPKDKNDEGSNSEINDKKKGNSASNFHSVVPVILFSLVLPFV